MIQEIFVKNIYPNDFPKMDYQDRLQGYNYFMRSSKKRVMFTKNLENRENVVNIFEYKGNNKNVLEKIEWIKDWILDSATSVNDLKNFLIPITGISKLKKITIQESPAEDLVAYSCMTSLEINTEKETKEHFITKLERMIIPFNN